MIVHQKILGRYWANVIEVDELPLIPMHLYSTAFQNEYANLSIVGYSSYTKSINY